MLTFDCYFVLKNESYIENDDYKLKMYFIKLIFLK